ncbi:MAG: L,D-transpeptidase [Methylococcaceae bacterium]|jgi:murein L,D-transpeptidase YafK
MDRIFLLIMCSFLASAVSADNNIWLLVDTTAQKIEVKKGEQTLDTIDGIAIGRGGAGYKNHRGDSITPSGSYTIGWVNEKSPFRKFYGFTYPSVDDAEKALTHGIINKYTYESILSAHRNHQIPPQDTPLGGQIGIHGLGRASEKIHKMTNWTHGCIAMTNGQIDHLSQWIDKGTVVRIK